MPSFHIRLSDDSLVFSAAHFIALEGSACERLHGHTYHVAVELHGPLGDERYIVDFLLVRQALMAILAELDHRVLLPTGHRAIRVSPQKAEVEVVFADRRWVFPADDCRPLPIANTTTELLAQYLGERLLAALALAGNTPQLLRVEVGEGTGASAACELP